VVTGATAYGAGGSDVHLLKTDAVGDTCWTKTFGGTCYDEGWSVRRTSDGGYIITGATTRSDTEQPNVCLIRTDANGDTLWTRSLGGAGEDCGSSVEQTKDGGFIIVANTLTGTPSRWDIYLVRTTADGDTLWSKTFGDTCYQFGFAVTQTPDGGYAVAGGTFSDEGRYCDVYLIRLDSCGDTLWTKTFGGTEFDIGYSMALTADGGFILAGYTRSFGTDHAAVYLIKTDANGDALWTRTFGGVTEDQARSVQPTVDAGYVIAGTTDCFGAGGSDVWLIKTDSLGNVAVAEPKASPTRALALSLTCEPNPFRTRTAISLQLTADGPAGLVIFDAAGQRVRAFTVNRAPYTVWDGKDDFGQPLPSGAYFVRVDAGNEHAATRLVLQR
jgi:hypothetical protein